MNGKDGIGLQRIIAYCGSRYLGCSCRLPLLRALRRKIKSTLLSYYSHFRKNEQKFPKMAKKMPLKVQKFTEKLSQTEK
jgi:hypothetical protein